MSADKNMHRRAQIAEGAVQAVFGVLDAWDPLLRELGETNVVVRHIRMELEGAVSKARALLPAQTEPDAGRVEVKPDHYVWEEDLINTGRWTLEYDDEPPYPHDRIRNIRPLYYAPPSPPREEIEHQGVVAVGVKG